MSKVLIVGNTGERYSAGAGAGACVARTLSFSNTLEKAGFEVFVCSPDEGRAGAKQVARAAAEDDYRCIVAISPFPAESAVMAESDLPIWIDMHGMHPAELQLQNRDDPRYGERFLRILAMENLLLRRGDAFSCPSIRQTAAITAELLLQGRASFGKGEGIVIHALPHSAGAFRERGFPDDGKFCVISTGSFNVWFDEITLFKGLETAMAGSDMIRFVATGGAIPFCPAKYSGFCEMVRQSPFVDRYSIPGWVSADELHAVYSSASAAVYTDIPSPETFLGARTRALDWICRGIPVVCTRGAEISETIEKNNLGIVLPSGDSAAIAQALLRLSQNRRLCEDIVLAQKQWCENEGSADEMYKPLMEWCRKPVRVYEKPLGRHTVPPLNSLGYFAMLYKELSEKAGIGYAAKRALKRLLPFMVLS